MENQKEEQFYLEDRRVKEIKVLDTRTPLDQDILSISFDTGENLIMPRKKFDVMKSFKKSDGTTARTKLITSLDNQMYALMIEYGLQLRESEAIMANLVGHINDSADDATSILWNVQDGKSRNLLSINTVLKDNVEFLEKKYTLKHDEPKEDTTA